MGETNTDPRIGGEDFQNLCTLLVGKVIRSVEASEDLSAVLITFEDNTDVEFYGIWCNDSTADVGLTYCD